MPEVSQCLQAEAYQGPAKQVNWDTIKENPLAKLENTPPPPGSHSTQSQKSCTILDLSFQIRMGGSPIPSVNTATHKQACQAFMHQLGKVLP